ncbi:DUF4268 domain-containing protein [Synechococcus sp. CBW1006]|uniref:DUF4268 domain-containing protein n=1 Tax=Synechococcus sp. CBW1006 TaxID=1353138 RepID=UPI0018CEC0A9|nr:DUF4268 domain-containing protein [Synechococcus sp. CBW1006]QPN65283.1 DUF4268 domain-containing protein [Synechococcus sp. CBW1006]
MNHSSIGKLQRVPLREVWKHEAYDFTQWLQENIDILNDSLDLNLITADREQAAGSFSIDLVAEDEDGTTYVIENQLEKSNHDHLGKLITYLTARSARGGIWIVSEPRPEHVAAMAWLNESPSADFYLVKVEAVRIGDSPAAPLLTLIVGPSEEAKSTGRAKQELSERHEIRKRWWAALITQPGAKLHAHITPGISSWLGASSGTPGLTYWYGVTKANCTAELYIDRGKGNDEQNKRIFDQLKGLQAEINSSITLPVTWERLDDRRACRIRISLPGGYRSLEDEWPAIQAKQISAMNELEQALRPALKNIRFGSQETAG